MESGTTSGLQYNKIHVLSLKIYFKMGGLFCSVLNTVSAQHFLDKELWFHLGMGLSNLSSN